MNKENKDILITILDGILVGFTISQIYTKIKYDITVFSELGINIEATSLTILLISSSIFTFILMFYNQFFKQK